MKNPLARKTRTVDIIVGGLTKLVTELEQAEASRTQEVKDKQAEINVLIEEQSFASAEASKAAAVKQKIQSLIS